MTMTQMQAARAGKITDEMKIVAQEEKMDINVLKERVANGTIAICANINHKNLHPYGVGEGLCTKVNANIGTSSAFPDPEPEIEKLNIAIAAGAHSVMDLSTGNNIDASRRAILDNSTVMVGTVPIYQATVTAIKERGAVVKMTEDDLLHTIEKQAKDGADFMTIHCGVTMDVINRMRAEGRYMDVVSRGGSFITGWMLYNEKNNPLYERYDDILDICAKYDVTMSLGDGLRPGCLADATDHAQIQELLNLGGLVKRAWDRGVQVMVEGPGHVPLDQVAANMKVQQSICMGAPFYVLGPLVTDIAPGYDHITGAIGGAVAAMNGAAFLCYVTPAEHLALPNVDDVRQGIIASKIAAHAADIAKGIPGAREMDDRMADARRNLDWEEQFACAMDPKTARAIRDDRLPEDDHSDTCSMCGKFCAVRSMNKALSGEYIDIL